MAESLIPHPCSESLVLIRHTVSERIPAGWR